MTDFFHTARDIVASQQAARDAFRVGVCWGGMAPEAPTVEDVDGVVARLVEDAERMAAAESTPRVRFHKAAFAIYQAGGGDTLLAISDRAGFDLPEPRALARADAYLVGKEGPAAEAARQALADWRAEA